jgi:hypothetical protein
MNQPLRGAISLALLLTAAACGSFRRGSGQSSSAIIFSNESLDQAAVYVVSPGVEFRRIGTVIPGRTDTLTVPADLVARAGTLNIVARLLARPDVPQTGPVSLVPGEKYQVRLTTDAKILSFLPAAP